MQSIDRAYKVHNFTGLVGWHYYNEPMLEHDRIFSLMERYPKARYILWTNGTVQPKDSRITKFDQIFCSDYNGINREYYKNCKNVSILTPRFDKRLEDTSTMFESTSTCWRQHTEFIVDNWGMAHLCCQDWRAEIEIGDVWTASFDELLKRRNVILDQMARGDYPKRCRQCNGKIRRVANFDKETHDRIITSCMNYQS